MFVVRALVFVVGAVLAGWSITSAVRTMVVPRALQSFLARAVFEGVRGVLRLCIGRSPAYERRDRIMALFGPVSMLMLPGMWLAVVLVGFTCMFWSLGSRSARTAFELSGSSLFTLGSRSAGDLPSTVLSFAEAGMGLGLLALLITYLPSLYATFNRRELAVALLEVRADSPPSGPNMIVRSTASAGTAGSPRYGRTGRRGSPTWRRPTPPFRPWRSSARPSRVSPG